MNILQVINAKWWNAEAAYAYSLTKGLMKRGHNVRVLVLPGSPSIEKAINEGVRYYETDGLNSYNPLKVMKALIQLARIILEGKIDVVNCHRSEGYPVVVLAAKISKTKVALIRTRGDQRHTRKGLLNKILYTKLADGIITSGEVVKKGFIKRLDISADDINVIYACVDTERFSPSHAYTDVRGELGISSDSPLVAILGRVSDVKGHRYFIEAASIVLKDIPQARFLIIVKEDDKNLDILKKQVSEGGLQEAVKFTGLREDIVDVMASCAIGVVASIGSETNCRVVLEWMAMGKPVVGTTVGVIPEVIRDGETGYLVPPMDSNALAEKITMLLWDRGKALAFGKAGRELVESVYNEALFVEKTLAVYRKAINKKK